MHLIFNKKNQVIHNMHKREQKKPLVGPAVYYICTINTLYTDKLD